MGSFQENNTTHTVSGFSKTEKAWRERMTDTKRKTGGAWEAGRVEQAALSPGVGCRRLAKAYPEPHFLTHALPEVI